MGNGAPDTAGTERYDKEIDCLLRTAASIDSVHRLVWVHGKDAVTYLDGLVTQSVANMEPGWVRRSFMLTPKGKVRSLLWILRGVDDRVGLITQASTSGLLCADLERFRFRVDVAILPEERTVLSSVGPQARSCLDAADLPTVDSGRWRSTVEGLIADVPFVPSGADRIVTVGDAAVALEQTTRTAGRSAYEAVRVLQGEALGLVDFDDSTIVHELGAVDDAVDFDKGCYLGQELVARIDSRGRVTQRLRTIALDGLHDVAGARVLAAGIEVGNVSSAARLPTGTTVGIARIRHQVKPGESVAVDTGNMSLQATVHELGADQIRYAM